ncbi:MAG: galactose ABC transporter substrate-binding protein [Clostridiales bacterium]|nr:galactose ABC transporter substrate-binding protein [Clostridiales bacterium]
MKRRNWAIVALAAVIAAGAAGFAAYDADTGTQEGQTLKIGLFAYRGDDTFISNLNNSFRDLVNASEKEQSKNIYLSIQEAGMSQATQNSQIERAIALGYKILCVNLVDRTSAAYVIDQAMEADVPIIFYNREPVQADMRKWDKVFYVGTDATMNGVLEGRIAANACKASPESMDLNNDGIIQYIMIEGEFRHQDAILRTEGSIQAMQEAGIAVEKLDGGVANWERSQGAALAKEFFAKYGSQIELFICNNDDMALGVIDYVDSENLNFTNIVGIDGTPQGLDAVAKGKMLGTVVIDYETQAQLMYDLVRRQLSGEAPEDFEDRYARAPMRVVERERRVAAKPGLPERSFENMEK